ncbi:response regulator [bacterium]|nr:response regulator [bacterium]
MTRAPPGGVLVTAAKSWNGGVRRVLIVDDHPMVRKGLRDLLDSEPGFEPCGEAANGDEAISQLADDPPDIMLLDLSLAEGSGLELVKQASARFPDVQILVFSMHDEELYAERTLEAGASGYVEKHSPVDELLEALRRVGDGKIHVSKDMTERLLQQRLATGAEPGTSVNERLSDRELQVFEELGRGRTTRQIAEDLHISIKTVERHCENIKDKLMLENRTQLLQHAVHWLLREV